jgi:hypothetical protein
VDPLALHATEDSYKGRHSEGFATGVGMCRLISGCADVPTCRDVQTPSLSILHFFSGHIGLVW